MVCPQTNPCLAWALEWVLLAEWTSRQYAEKRNVPFWPSLEQHSEAGCGQSHPQVLLDLTYYIIISLSVKRRRIGHGSIHHPTFGFVLCSYEILNLPAIRSAMMPSTPPSAQRTPQMEHDPVLASTPSIWQVSVYYNLSSTAATHLFARLFPHRSTLCSCSSVHASRSTDLTRLMCVPIPRWIPEHL